MPRSEVRESCRHLKACSRFTYGTPFHRVSGSVHGIRNLMHLAICRFGFDKNILIVSFASPRIKDIETATPKQPSKRFQREVVALLVMDAPRLVVVECATRVEHFEVGHSPAPAEHVAMDLSALIGVIAVLFQPV